ncbi:rhodanese domain-containing protein [Candidatus Magnetomorum sp. HK-1]|nr:rhodanese domain-containing protein [Candidatus Magnetomorum sp. HK-1]
MGYKKVLHFPGGIQEWRGFNYPMKVNDKYAKIKIKKISPKKMSKIIKQKNPFIVDVRPDDFIKDSYIKDSVHCQTLNLVEASKKFPKDRPLLVVDWAMKQSPIAAQYLKLSAFDVLGILKGGVERWKSEGFPVEIRKHTK